MADIQKVVRTHQTEAEWPHQEVAKLAYTYYDPFRNEHFPELPDPIFRCGPTNIKTSVTYTMGDNDFGARFDCIFNSKWLCVPRYVFAANILHVMIHIWQEDRKSHSPSGNHNAEFTQKAFVLGIPATGGRSCKIISYDTDFMKFVEQIDPDYKKPCVDGAEEPAAAPRPKSIRYFCDCASCRALPGLQFTCDKCGQPLLPEIPL